MNKKAKVKLKETILKEIEKLKEDIATYKDITKPIAPDNAIGRLTRMDAIGRKHINEAAMRNAENSLAKLELGLSKIDNPDFGLCKKCEKPIPQERLMILPGSTLCVSCMGKR